MAIGPLEQKKKVVVETESGDATIKVEHPQKVFEKEKRIVKGKQYIWYACIVVELILLFRFILLFMGVSLTTSLFGIVIATLSAPLLLLFDGLFPATTFPNSGIIIEWSTLFAMFVYVALTWLLSILFGITKPISPQEVEEKIKQDNSGII